MSIGQNVYGTEWPYRRGDSTWQERDTWSQHDKALAQERLAFATGHWYSESSMMTGELGLSMSKGLFDEIVGKYAGNKFGTSVSWRSAIRQMY